MKLSDPFQWCGRPIAEIERDGCGASRFPELCWLAPIVAEVGAARALAEAPRRWIR